VPIVFAPLVGFTLGAAFAWIAGPALARGDRPLALTPAFGIVAAFAGLVWLPALGYFVAFHCDWSYLYLAPPHPSAVDLALALVASGCVLAGFVVSARPARNRRPRPVLAAALAPAALAVIGVLGSFRRLLVDASYAQYHGDFGIEPVGSTVLGKAVAVMAALVVGAVAWTIYSLDRLSPPP
jgi:hypothetical protein